MDTCVVYTKTDLVFRKTKAWLQLYSLRFYSDLSENHFEMSILMEEIESKKRSLCFLIKEN